MVKFANNSRLSDNSSKRMALEDFIKIGKLCSTENTIKRMW